MLPGFVERQIISAFQDAGLKDVSVNLQDISFSDAVLENLSFGGGDQYRIDNIHVFYTIHNVDEFQVDSILLSGLQFRIGLQDSSIDLGPLNDLQSGGDEGDGFVIDYISIRESNLHVDWSGNSYHIPLNAGLRMLRADSIDMTILGTLEGAALQITSHLNLESFTGRHQVLIENLSGDILQQAADHYNTAQPLTVAGNAAIDGEFISRQEAWQMDFTLNSTDLSIAAFIDTFQADIKLAPQRAHIQYATAAKTSFDLDGWLNDAPISLNGDFHLDTGNGRCNFRITALDAEHPAAFLRPYLPEVPFQIDGQIDASGSIRLKKNRGGISAKIDGQALQIKSIIAEQDWHAAHPEITVETKFQLAGNDIASLASVVDIHGAALKNDSLNLTIADAFFSMPYSSDKSKPLTTDFTLKNIRYEDQSFPEFSGEYQFHEDWLTVQGSGKLLPEAAINIRAKFDLSRDALAGQLEMDIPEFEIKNGSALADRLPTLNADRVNGVLTASGVFDFKAEKIIPDLKLDVRNGTWKNNDLEATISGINGALHIDSFRPFTSAGKQQFTFRKGVFSSFETTDGKIDFRILNADTIAFAAVEVTWANGTLSSQDFIYETETSEIDFVLTADSLDLQGILDFFDYDGVSGSGKIFGQLPMTVNWENKNRIDLGEGYLEARPQTGRLQFSKETAQTILGIEGDIDPETADSQKILQLMMQNALQDMEYTAMKILFTREFEVLKTQVNVQGKGPFNDPENLIPIGGLTININQLDVLLNDIVLSN